MHSYYFVQIAHYTAICKLMENKLILDLSYRLRKPEMIFFFDIIQLCDINMLNIRGYFEDDNKFGM